MFNTNEIGQMALYDCMFAVFIFIIVFTAFTTAHNMNFQTGEEINKLNEMKNVTHNAMESLINFEGKPSNWDSENVEIIGLAEKKGVLSEEKVSEFALMEYEKIQEKIVFGRYNFFLEIDSEREEDDLNAGQAIGNEADVIKIERNVLYKEAITNVRLSVYE